MAELEEYTEIIVSDSSTDRTPEIAWEMGAIIKPDKQGNGHGYRFAFQYVRGEYVVFGDANCTYDFKRARISASGVGWTAKSNPARCRRSTSRCAGMNGALNIGKRALGKFLKPLSRAGAGLERPQTQVIVNRDEEPANLSVSVGSPPSGGTQRL